MQLYAVYFICKLCIVASCWTFIDATGSNNGPPVPDAVDTVICASDDGWRNHPKHVEQFTDKISCV